MRMSPKARMNRLFTHGRCLDVAIDHGVCNEPSFMAGLEDIGGVVDQLIAAGPDATVLAEHGRPVLRLHLTSHEEGLARVRAALGRGPG